MSCSTPSGSEGGQLQVTHGQVTHVGGDKTNAPPGDVRSGCQRPPQSGPCAASVGRPRSPTVLLYSTNLILTSRAARHRAPSVHGFLGTSPSTKPQPPDL
jgi:hypothetical protein